MDSTSLDSYKAWTDQEAAEERAKHLLREEGDILSLRISKEDEDLLKDSDEEKMDMDNKDHGKEVQDSVSESTNEFGYSSVPISEKTNEARYSERNSSG